MATLEEYYDAYERIEEQFQAVLDESLQPRGPDFLYDIVRDLGLPAGVSAIDVGCGEGQQSIELAKRFAFRVIGIDPVSHHIELANEAARGTPERDLIRFELGTAESMPVEDGSIDLIWCRESHYYFDLDVAFAECRRVLRDGGRMLIYSNFATERMEPRESAWWHSVNRETVPSNSDPRNVEAAIMRAGFAIEQDIELGTEFGEYAAEHTGRPAQQLVHAARLLRAPERYIAQFGKTNYDIMFADALWHVYRMIGKLSSRIYVVRKT